MRTRPRELLTRALSIRQPYVEAIFRGKKDADYRSWPTTIRGRVYVYASLRTDDTVRGLGVTADELPGLPRGVIVGSVELTGCRWDARRDCYAWKLARPTRYAQLYQAIGQPQPSFWRPRWRRS
jgi:hypothetical protein